MPEKKKQDVEHLRLECERLRGSFRHQAVRWAAFAAAFLVCAMLWDLGALGAVYFVLACACGWCGSFCARAYMELRLIDERLAAAAIVLEQAPAIEAGIAAARWPA